MMWAKDRNLEITLKILDNAALHKGFNWNIITENTYNRQQLLAIIIPSLKHKKFHFESFAILLQL